MWVIQEPNKVALWNKRHFEEKKWRLYSMLKIFSTDVCWINIKWGIWRVILRPSYIQDARFLKVKQPLWTRPLSEVQTFWRRKQSRLLKSRVSFFFNIRRWRKSKEERFCQWDYLYSSRNTLIAFTTTAFFSKILLVLCLHKTSSSVISLLETLKDFSSLNFL